MWRLYNITIYSILFPPQLVSPALEPLKKKSDPMSYFLFLMPPCPREELTSPGDMYLTSQRRRVFSSLVSLRLPKDTKDAQRQACRFPDVDHCIWATSRIVNDIAHNIVRMPIQQAPSSRWKWRYVFFRLPTEAFPGVPTFYNLSSLLLTDNDNEGWYSLDCSATQKGEVGDGEENSFRPRSVFRFSLFICPRLAVCPVGWFFQVRLL